MKKILLITSLILFTLVSCTKDKVNNPANIDEFGPDIFLNSNNPNDSVGIIHNECIYYYIENRTYIGTDLDSLISEMNDLISDYLTSINPNHYQSNIKTNYLTILNNATTNFLYGYSNKDYIEDNFTNDYAIEKSCELQTLVAYSNENNYTIYELIDSIKAYESRVLNDSILSQTEKNKLLNSSSVTRLSLKLWIDQMSNPNSDWNQYPINVEFPEEYTPTFGLAKWFKAVITLVIPTTVERAGITAGADGVTAVATGGNGFAAAGVSVLTALALHIFDIP